MSAVEILRDGLRAVLRARTLEEARAGAREALRHFNRTPTLDDIAATFPAAVDAEPAEPLPLPDPSWSPTGRARATDPDTSQDASLDNLPRAGSQRSRCLAAVASAGMFGMTASECEEKTGLPVSSVSKRLGELRTGGWLRHERWNGAVVTRTTARGSKGAVYYLTAKAKEEMP